MVRLHGAGTTASTALPGFAAAKNTCDGIPVAATAALVAPLAGRTHAGAVA